MTHRIPAAAVLFDMDGTLIDSTTATEHVWLAHAERMNADPDELLSVLHGVRAEETVARFVGDPEERAAIEKSLREAELAEADGVEALDGADELIASLPEDKVAIVTSATRDIMDFRLGAAGVREPKIVVTADDVDRGKPDPLPYVTAAERLGVDPAACVVVEDAEAGVRAGLAAGAQVIVVGDLDSEVTRGLPRVAAPSGIRVEFEGDQLVLVVEESA